MSNQSSITNLIYWPNTVVFDNGGKAIDRYTVLIDDNVYTMSEDAASIQGVNQLSGTLSELGFKDGLDFIHHIMAIHGDTQCQHNHLPPQVIMAIQDRMPN